MLNLIAFTRPTLLYSSRLHRPPPRILHLLGVIVTLIGLTACAGPGSQAAESADLPVIRTPHPTFTPTPQTPPEQAPVATPASESVALPVQGEQNAGSPSAGQGTPAKVVVNTPLVNVRTGPGTDFEVVATVERGDEYEIVGKNADGTWWQVCCVNDAPVWIIGEYVDTDGPVDAVPVADAGGNAPAQAAPAAQNAPVAPAAPSGPAAYTFDLRNQEQFPETGLVRIFLYVYSGNNALAGYSLRVTKDGTALPVNGVSFAGQPAFTWPFQDARQRYQNFKVEFPDVPPAGVWELQLIDSNGNAVGPPATFTLSQNDPQQELYVRYEQR